MMLVLFSLCQSIATQAKPEKKTDATNTKDTQEIRVFTIKGAVLPSFQLEVINQELPWMEEIRFKLERNERPVNDFSAIVRRFYIDLFRVITPSNAP